MNNDFRDFFNRATDKDLIELFNSYDYLVRKYPITYSKLFLLQEIRRRKLRKIDEA